MCTISWLYQANNYHVFFNRDEQLSRPLASPPQLFLSQNEPSVLMPIDPQGLGSWVSVNDAGITFALLNYYQGRLPKGRLKSRGQIVRALSSLTNVDSIRQYMGALPLEKFAPFSLLVFEPEIGRSTQSVPLWRWDGRTLNEGLQTSPLISSAKCYDDVVRERMAIYNAKIKGEGRSSVEDFYRLHQDHGEQASAKSICMHRKDACTVSFSHIAVSQEAAVFRYKSGPACSALPLQLFTLER